MDEKLAFVTDDGKMLSAHFGMARNYLVVQISDGRVSGQELRAKPSHKPMAHIDGVMEDSQNERHTHSMSEGMLEGIKDCTVVIAGGMGRPMYEALNSAGIKVFITGIRQVSQALDEYTKGTLKNDVRRVH